MNQEWYHTCNLSYSGGRDERTAVQGQPGGKVTTPYLKNKLKAKRVGSIADVVEPSKYKVLSIPIPQYSLVEGKKRRKGRKKKVRQQYQMLPRLKRKNFCYIWQ
jgi:hypothetical protein